MKFSKLYRLLRKGVSRPLLCSPQGDPVGDPTPMVRRFLHWPGVDSQPVRFLRTIFSLVHPSFLILNELILLLADY